MVRWEGIREHIEFILVIIFENNDDSYAINNNEGIIRLIVKGP